MNKIVAAVGMATLSLGVLAEDNVAKYMWDGNAGNLNLADSGNWYLDGTQDGEKQRGLPSLNEESYFKYHTDRAVLKDQSSFETLKLEVSQWGGIAQIDVTNATMQVVNNLMIGSGGGSAAVNIYDDATVDAGFVEVGFWNSHQDCSLNVYGGNLIASSNDWAGSIVIGKQSESPNHPVKGEMNVYGGTVSAFDSIKIGYGPTVNPCRETASVLSIEGGRTTGVVMELGCHQPTASGYVSVSCGELALSGDMNIACHDNTWCEVDVSGGSLSVGGTLRVGNDAEALHAAMTVSGGEVNVGTLSIARQCDGTVNLTGGIVYATKIEQSSSAPESAVSRIYANGGEIVAKGDNDSFMTRLDEVCLGASGLVIDDGGYTVKATGTCTFTGIGGITKEGTGTLKLDAAYNAHGVINVLSGTLRLPANATVYCEGVNVAGNATLNYNNATVVTVTKEVVSSVWTGAAGDGDVSNPANWRSAVAFFDEDGNEIAEIAATYDGVAPAEDTPVRVPAGLDLGDLATGEVTYVVDSDISLVAGFDATYENYAAGSLVATENLKILNNLNGLLKSAVAWYDPSDVATLTVGDDGFVKTVANKGYLGAKMNAQAREQNGSAVIAAEEFKQNGLNVLVFTNNVGYTSAEKLGTIADDQPRALFVVSARQIIGDFAIDYELFPDNEKNNKVEVMGIEIADTSHTGGNQPGVCGIDQVGWGNRTRMHVAKDGSDEQQLAEANFGAAPYGRAVVLAMNAKATSVSSAQRYRSDDGQSFVRDTKSAEYQKLFGGENMSVDYGWRAEWSCRSRGRLGEALAFTRDLGSDAAEAVESYLAAKWLGDESAAVAIGTTSLGSLVLENSDVDFDGAAVKIGTLSGSGAIVNAVSLDVDAVSFNLDPDGALPRISLSVSLDLSESGINVSPDVLSLVGKADAPVALLETTGSLAIGRRRRFTAGNRRYVVFAETKDGVSRLMAGRDAGFAVSLR
jgi:hypothetical protein